MNEEKYLKVVSEGLELQKADDAQRRLEDLSIDEIMDEVHNGNLDPEVAIELLLSEAGENAATDKAHQGIKGRLRGLAQSAWTKMPRTIQDRKPWQLWLGGASIFVASIATGFGIRWLKTHHVKKIATAAASKLQMMANAEGLEADPAVMNYILKKLSKDKYTKIKLKNILNVHGGGREQLAMDRASDFLAKEAMKMMRMRSGPRLPKIVPPPPLAHPPSARGFVHPPGHTDPLTNIDMAQAHTGGTEFIGGHLPMARMDRPMGEEGEEEDMNDEGEEEDMNDEERYEEEEVDVDVEDYIDAVLEGYTPEDVANAMLEKGGLGRAMVKGAKRGAAYGMAGGGAYGLATAGKRIGKASTRFSQLPQEKQTPGRALGTGFVAGATPGVIGTGVGAGIGAGVGAYKYLKGKKKKTLRGNYHDLSK